jgi:hypothetical protein
MVVHHAESLDVKSEKDAFVTSINPLLDAASPYTKSSASGVGGSERALNGFLEILRKWITVERWFCEDDSYADSVDKLRKANKDNFAHALEVCRAHALLKSTASIILRIIDIFC